ncbi:Threonine dehydrogenase [Blastococcus aggregatus]|uniref:Threonine dehydrogenase n=1 Tax=Blastococcus aggregatus TaxID=38502 RepID=A0A285V5T6_9ACTN|nr:zinc-binding dehydrogenase [Blastococcus aggregatus]SOC49492.1 Threonine dehydrogenase [Blastococcus aggregatus]
MSLPSHSRAALLRAFGEPASIEDVPVPQELEPGSLLVRISMASVCGTDVHIWEGGAFNASADNLPSVMGHEMVGEVVAFGEGPHKDSLDQPLSLGDRVVWTHAPCGRCFFCTVDRQPSLCSHRQSYGRLSAHRFPYLTGGFAEYCYVFPGSGRVRVPDEVRDSWAAPASCALRTVVHVLEQVGGVEPHETVVVQGAGPLGLYATAMLRAAGVGSIVVIGAPDSRLELATTYGATGCVSVEHVPDAAERARRVRDLTREGRGADVVLELSGAASAVPEGLALLRAGGRYGIAGQTNAVQAAIDPSVLVKKQLTLRGVLSAHVGHYWKALDFLRQTRETVDWDALTTAPVALDRVTMAMQSMKRGVMKPLIDPAL